MRLLVGTLICLFVVGALLVLELSSEAAPSSSNDSHAAAMESSSGDVTSSAECTQSYTYTVSSGSVENAQDLVAGSQCPGGCVVPLDLPFPVTFYDQTYTSANVSTAGNLQFVTNDFSPQSCPIPLPQFGPTMLPYWDSRFDTSWSQPCQSVYRADCGVFTRVLGSAPNRKLDIEWRARASGSNHETIDFELKFYENSDRFDFVYGSGLLFGGATSIGVQNGPTQYTTYMCNLSGDYQNTSLHWVPQAPATCQPTPTAVNTDTATATDTAVSTDTPTQGPTDTATPTVTSTPTSTSTPTPSATPTVCVISFSDVLPGSTFSAYVHCLACLDIVQGYPDGSFRPNDNVTRAQASKILAESAGFTDDIPPAQQTFNDVPSGSTFWLYIERVALHSAINGYPCGGPGQPCPGMYFRPQNTLTRGQASKIMSIVAGYTDAIPPDQQTFNDVPPGSTFWLYIERVALHGVVNGYSNGTFRPQNPATRGQLAKIATIAFLPGCGQ